MEGEDSIKGVIIYQWFIQQWDCIVKHWVRKIDMLSLLISQALENCPWFLLNQYTLADIQTVQKVQTVYRFI